MKDRISIRIKIGDSQAFELLFKTYYPVLCSYANKFLFSAEEARDVVQDVFIKLWENRREINPDESLKGWLFKATANSSLNKLRRRKVQNRYDEVLKLVYIEHSDSTPHDSLLEHELSEHIALAKNRMPPQCRRIFNLSRVEGLKYGEIAEYLKISVKTVEGHMTKALAIIRAELKEYLK